ncbi:hypothetical protein ACNOYE_20725 [Nannocystaceae bacterium ST9]
MSAVVGGEPQRDSEAEARAEAAVFADARMQAGDPRGELLALELAAANTRDPLRARRIHRVAQVLRDRHPHQAWPELPGLDAVPLQIRAGFVLAAELYEGEGRSESLDGLGRLFDVDEARPASHASASVLIRLLDHGAADHLRRLQLGGLAPAELDAAIERLAQQPGRLELLGLGLSGPQQLDALAPRLAKIAARGLRIEYDRVTSLLLGAAQERISLARAVVDPTLRVLSLAGYVDPRPLVDSAIEALDCWCRSASDLEQIAALACLRRLCLRHDDGLQPLARAQGLEALALQIAQPVELDVLSELPNLRNLALQEPSGRAPSSLAGLTGLERLELRDAIPARLDELSALAGLEVLGLRGGTNEPGPLDLGPLAELPRLRALTLDLFSHTPRGCDLLHPLRSLTVIGRVDLRWFAGTALDELTITGGIPPRVLPRLAELGPLRKLRLPARVLEGIDGATLARLLPELEELELFRATATLTPDQFAGFPRLRRLVLGDLGRGRARFFAEELPEVVVETLTPISDPLGLAAPFDWRSAGWPRDVH